MLSWQVYYIESEDTARVCKYKRVKSYIKFIFESGNSTWLQNIKVVEYSTTYKNYVQKQ